MDNRTSPDLLSDLHLSIIHIILSLLPIRDAVRTSLLSRQWRYIWASLLGLTFDEECVNLQVTNYCYNSGGFKRLVHFISQALFLHKGPIHKFQLSLPFLENSHLIDQWLLFLSRNDIRVLVLESSYGIYGYMHSSVYSCQYLTRLKLQAYTIPPPPQSFKGFLWLRILDLRMVQVSSATIESIVALSPLLEELILEGIEDWELTIRAPNLKYLYFNSSRGKLCLCTPLIEELSGHFGRLRYFNIGVESFQGSSSMLLHLTILNLYGVRFNREDVAQAVIRLITSSPNLQKLEISGDSIWEDDASELASASLWDTESAPDFTYDSLKVIKVEDFCGVLDEMKLIRFLLARSPVLEKMTYTPDPSVPDEGLLNLMAQLLSFRRASANAEIAFDLDDSCSTISTPLQLLGDI